MKRVVRITESELVKTLRNLISEEMNQDSLQCVPWAFRAAVNNFLKINFNKTLLKTCLGIIGRESDFGESNRYKLKSYLNPILKLTGNPSLGPAQIKKETGAEFGMSEDELLDTQKSLWVVYQILKKNYDKAVEEGYTTSPSVNLKGGTGNSALDFAIAAYNLGQKKITKYCETDDSEVKRPCSSAGQTVQESSLNEQTGIEAQMTMGYKPKPYVKQYKVTSKHVPNYIPNFETKRWDGVEITTHGYVREVAKRILQYGCF